LGKKSSKFLILNLDNDLYQGLNIKNMIAGIMFFDMALKIKKFLLGEPLAKFLNLLKRKVIKTPNFFILKKRGQKLIF
jgi:hypothetical protein